MANPELNFIIKDKLEKLSTICIENAGEYRDYTEQELFQASIIFQEVFMARMYAHNKDKLSFEQLKDLAHEAGKSLHQTTLLFTGVDLHKVQ